MRILDNLFPHPAEFHPTQERPLRLVGRVMQTGQSLPAHSHTWGQVTYAPQGVLKVFAAEQIWIVPPTRAIWIPPNCMHGICAMEASQTRILHIWHAHVPFPDADCRVLEVSPLLKELIARLEMMDEAGNREERLCEVIKDELRFAETLPMHIDLPQDKRLKVLCDHLLENPGSEMSLDDFSRHVGASVRTLARLFEQELGMNFVMWRQQVRLAHAFVLLSKKLPLSQVASQLGYSSQSAFSSMFKKALGKPPTYFMT